MIRLFKYLPCRVSAFGILLAVLLAGTRPVAIAAGSLEPEEPTNTFTVDDTGDFPDMFLNGVCASPFGTCTLRAAIEEVNHFSFASGPHHINFNIPGAGVHTILIYSELPQLQRAVVIDGTTQPGAACPTSSTAATIKIVVDGSNVPTAFNHGLDLWRNATAPSGSTIRGLGIGGFDYGVWLDGDGHTIECSHIGVGANGITPLSNDEAGVMVWQGSGNLVGGSSYADRNVISGNDSALDIGILVDNATNTTIQGNYIGTSALGTLDVGNVYGIKVVDSANNVTIGGTATAQRNLISGNSTGIIVDGDNVEIVNNFIGTNLSGTGALPNFDGIKVLANAANLTIGGGLTSEGNRISGNTSDAVEIDDADGATILNNKIGTTLNGAGVLGNGGIGIYLNGTVNNTQVGQPSDGNTIANNAAGIVHYYGFGYLGNSTHGNSFRGNLIHDNDDLGIDLRSNASAGVTLNDGAGDADNGPNGLQNYPGLVIARNSGYVLGLLATRGNIEYTIDFYQNDTCDDSGYGEGQVYLDTISATTDALGYATIDTTLANAPRWATTRPACASTCRRTTAWPTIRSRSTAPTAWWSCPTASPTASVPTTSTRTAAWASTSTTMG